MIMYKIPFQKEKVKDMINKFIHNKYCVTMGIFVVWIFFFDEYSIYNRIQYRREINRLNNELEYYNNDLEESKQKTLELRSSNENLEKFAREQYLMKRPNEDIFIIK